MFLMILVAIILLVVFAVGVQVGVSKSYDRCMHFMEPFGYPATGYCKLFAGYIKARDE